ncbi:cytochrome P450, partial [Mycena pura]
YQSDNLRLSLLPYAKQCAAFHQMLQPRVVGGYEGMQYTESLWLLADLVTAPAEYYHHFLRFPASLVFTLSYGQRINDDGKDLAGVERIFTILAQDSSPGAHLVDTFPILDRLPDFLAPWRAEAKEKHRRELEVTHLWDQQVKLDLTDKEIFYVAGTAFAAGTDTSVTTLLWFIMAMALYPATMKKAQQEIDSIFNSHTLPVFTRMQDLPYCFALVKEVLRWAPTVPLSVPHYSDADDEYNGYKVCITHSQTVISSLWNMHHNEDEYPNSYTFDPERFLSTTPGKAAVDDSLADGHYGFGFGRRRCPGQHLAMKSTWIQGVRVLWAFDIVRRRDTSGNLMTVDPNLCTSGLTSESRPQEFPVDFVSRSVTHIETIMSGQEII